MGEEVLCGLWRWNWEGLGVEAVFFDHLEVCWGVGVRVWAVMGVGP